MPSFAYKGIDSSGKTVTGQLEAGDRRGALRQLATQKIQPLSVDQQQDAASAAADLFKASQDYYQQKDVAAAPSTPKRRIRIGLSKSKQAQALEFLKNVLMLLNSGMPLGDSLRLLHNRLNDPKQKELAGELWKSLSEGRTFSDSMREFPGFFTESHIQLVAAGEASGNLVSVLRRIVDHLSQMRELKRNLGASLAYPVIVITIAIIIVFGFLFFLLPLIRRMIETLGGQMPFFTRVFMATGDIMLHWGPFAIAGILLAVVGISQWRKKEAGRTWTDSQLLKLPVAGSIYLSNSVFQTTSLLSTLLDSGVNTSDALRLVERTVPNTILRAKFNAARRMIQEGVSLSAAFRRVNYMPDLAMDILTVGENTGNISTALHDINEIYRQQLTKRLNLLTNVISTVALIMAFSFVAMIALTIVTSVLGMSQSIAR